METPLGLHSTDNTMKLTLGCTHTKAHTLALYIILFLYLCLAYPTQAQNIRWQQSNCPYGGYIRSFVNNGTMLFAGTEDGGVFRSSNNGTNWTQVNAGIPNITVSALTVSGTGMLFAGTNGGGMFRSLDNGTTWRPVNLGLTDSDVSSLTVSGNGTLFAGTYRGGVFRSSDNGAT